MNFTRWLIVGLVALIGAVDIGLAVWGGMDATISVQITKWSHEYIAIPFAFGFLAGHWFGQNAKGSAPQGG
jgi:hypothetical protein